MRFAVWRNTIVAIAVYALAIGIADREIFQHTIRSRPLALALSFATVQLAMIALMLGLLFGWKRRNVLRQARSERLANELDEALALHLIGEDQTPALRKLMEQSRYDVREKLFTMVSTTRGEARDRLTALALDLQLVERGADVELQGIRDYIRLAHGQDFDAVVRWSAARPLLARAIVADEYAPYAGSVSDEQIVGALNAPDRRVVLATLEMLCAWRRTVRIPGFTMLLASPDARVRAAAFDALSYVAAGQGEDVVAEAIKTGLRHDDPRVRRSAAVAAGRMSIGTVIEALHERLNDTNRDVAVAAAWALASIGDTGLAMLEASLASPSRSADVAFEMWEKAAIGRLSLV